MSILAPDPRRILDRFMASLATAHTTARVQHRPFNPLEPQQVITHEGEDYAVEWRGRQGTSKTEPIDFSVTRRQTGRAYEFALIRSERRSKTTGRATVRYSLTGQGSWTTLDETVAGLVALAAPKLAGINAYNPVTGMGFLPVRIGSAA